MIPIPTLKTVKNIVIVCHSFAIPTTCFRLFHRCRTGKLWWDDFWAMIALLCDIILFVVYFAIPLEPQPTPKALQYASRWLTLQGYTIGIWSARLTVAVTIVRLLPQGPTRRMAKVAAMIFGVFEMVMVLQKIFFCGKKWGFLPRCEIPTYTGIIELVTDILADLWLLLAPAYMLFQMKLERAHHRLILAIFLCGIFTSLASISHSVFILLNSPFWLGLTGHIEVAVAIVISNLLVLVTYIYRVFRHVSNNMRRPNAVDSTAPRAANSADPATSQSDSSPARTVVTTIELTELSHLGSTFNDPTNSETTGTTPFSSFSYPTRLQSADSAASREPRTPTHS
ncbi:hypothetical protein GALMADRAFT_247965 [Galerina marginata CBS 339.88]|uniref:Rhodopsin domain-containing protein n=1 Tax=Galerina marginata (strain CBS 339.88) TaxID=685588 RepID=A0A067SX70_GALM3|nr:hypothetical protein GALMADRAFT_247965 [Galerina marginata CBS 339.88]